MQWFASSDYNLQGPNRERLLNTNRKKNEEMLLIFILKRIAKGPHVQTPV